VDEAFLHAGRVAAEGGKAGADIFGREGAHGRRGWCWRGPRRWGRWGRAGS
jgi:hypothetical protein